MVSGITPCAQECKWIVYFGEPPYAGSEQKSFRSSISHIVAEKNQKNEKLLIEKNGRFCQKSSSDACEGW